MWKFIIFSLFYFGILVYCQISNNIENEDVLNEEIDYLSDLPLEELIKIKKSLNILNINSDNDDDDIDHHDDDDDSDIKVHHQHDNSDSDKDDDNIGGENIESNEDLIESRDLPASGRDLSSFPLVGSVIKKFLNKTSKFNIFGLKKKKKNPETGRSSIERSYEQWEDKEPTKIETIFQISITGLSFLAFGGYLLCMIVQAIKSRGTTYYHPSTAIASLNTNQSAQPIKKIKVFRRSKRKATTIINGKKEKSIRNSFKTDDENMLASPSPDEMYCILKLFAEGYVKLVDN